MSTTKQQVQHRKLVQTVQAIINEAERVNDRARRINFETLLTRIGREPTPTHSANILERLNQWRVGGIGDTTQKWLQNVIHTKKNPVTEAIKIYKSLTNWKRNKTMQPDAVSWVSDPSHNSNTNAMNPYLNDENINSIPSHTHNNSNYNSNNALNSNNSIPSHTHNNPNYNSNNALNINHSTNSPFHSYDNNISEQSPFYHGTQSYNSNSPFYNSNSHISNDKNSPFNNGNSGISDTINLNSSTMTVNDIGEIQKIMKEIGNKANKTAQGRTLRSFGNTKQGRMKAWSGGCQYEMIIGPNKKNKMAVCLLLQKKAGGDGMTKTKLNETTKKVFPEIETNSNTSLSIDFFPFIDNKSKKNRQTLYKIKDDTESMAVVEYIYNSVSESTLKLFGLSRNDNIIPPTINSDSVADNNNNNMQMPPSMDIDMDVMGNGNDNMYDSINENEYLDKNMNASANVNETEDMNDINMNDNNNMNMNENYNMNMNGNMNNINMNENENYNINMNGNMNGNMNNINMNENRHKVYITEEESNILSNLKKITPKEIFERLMRKFDELVSSNETCNTEIETVIKDIVQNASDTLRKQLTQSEYECNKLKLKVTELQLELDDNAVIQKQEKDNDEDTNIDEYMVTACDTIATDTLHIKKKYNKPNVELNQCNINNIKRNKKKLIQATIGSKNKKMIVNKNIIVEDSSESDSDGQQQGSDGMSDNGKAMSECLPKVCDDKVVVALKKWNDMCDRHHRLYNNYNELQLKYDELDIENKKSKQINEQFEIKYNELKDQDNDYCPSEYELLHEQFDHLENDYHLLENDYYSLENDYYLLQKNNGSGRWNE